MRVLYVNHTSAVSGAERSLLALLAALPRDVEALVASPPGHLSEAVERLGIATTPIVDTVGSLRLHPLHTPRALAEMSVAALQVRRAARRHRADVVHANSIRAGLELALARVSPAVGIVHVRDCLPPGALTTATMRTIAAGARTIVANSQYTADTVTRTVTAARIEVVHPAIDLAEFDPARIDRAAARAALGVAGTRRVLLGVVAQLSPWKGQDTAIETLRLLREQDLDAHLLLIGEAKFVARATRFDNEAYVSGLRRLVAEAGLEDRVSWLGQREDVPQLIRALDVLLLPSHEEPFGRVLLEAMALEVPVLATSVGGPAELVTEGIDGYLVPPREPAAWAQGVRRVVGGPAQGRALGRAGRLRIAEAFDAKDHAAAMLAVYERARRGP
jgi:glycosyltransferase involved in cell wall biosynthesis